MRRTGPGQIGRWLALLLGCWLSLLLPVQAAGVITVTPVVVLHVGQSQVVHGLVGTCRGPPAKALRKAVNFRTGHLEYGQAGVRLNRACGGVPTPAVETIFVADTPGTEVISLYGDRIRVSVIP